MKRALLLLLLAACASSPPKALKRPMPDYSGRGPEPTTAGDVLIWVPRVAVSPLYFISEFVLRRPMRWLIVTGEREQWPTRVINFLGLDQPIGIVPTFYFDLGFHPTVGFYMWWNDFLATGNALRATASIGVDFATATITDRVTLGGGKWQLAFRGHATSRSDAAFYGLGPRSRTDDLSRYEIRRLEASAAAEWRFAGPGARLRLQVGERDTRFGSDGCCDEPTIAESVAAGRFAEPPGIALGRYGGPYGQLSLVLDSRRAPPESGVGLTLTGEAGDDLANGQSWLRGSATAIASLDVTGRRRVFSLIFDARLAEPIGDEGKDVPFTEQVTLGGAGQLPGFRGSRLIGRSAVSGTLLYEWPVWAYLAGAAHVGVGNVFGPDFDGFEVGLLRMSAGLGLRSMGISDHRFELLIAIGTDPFDDGAKIDAVRLVFGGVTGF